LVTSTKYSPQPVALVHARARQVQAQLLAVHAPLARDAAADALAHDDHAAFLAPAVQLQLGLDHLAALAVGSAPVVAGELPRDQPLHVLGPPQPQQVGLVAALQLREDALVTVARVAAHERRAPIATRILAEFVEQPPKRRLGMHARPLHSTKRTVGAAHIAGGGGITASTSGEPTRATHRRHPLA
jgi:hypothetical protein